MEKDWIEEMDRIGLPLATAVFWDGRRIVIVTAPDMPVETQKLFAQQLRAFQVERHEFDVEEFLDTIKANKVKPS